MHIRAGPDIVSQVLPDGDPIDLRAARKAFGSAPRSQFRFGPLRVSTAIQPRARLRDGSRLAAIFRSPQGRELTAELPFLGTYGGLALSAGVDGTLDDEPFTISRNGPRLRRRSRVVTVSGAVELQAASSWFAKAKIWEPGPSHRLICQSDGGSASLASDASFEQAAICCLLLTNSIPESTSLLRWLNGL